MYPKERKRNEIILLIQKGDKKRIGSSNYIHSTDSLLNICMLFCIHHLQLKVIIIMQIIIIYYFTMYIVLSDT